MTDGLGTCPVCNGSGVAPVIRMGKAKHPPVEPPATGFFHGASLDDSLDEPKKTKKPEFDTPVSTGFHHVPSFDSTEPSETGKMSPEKKKLWILGAVAGVIIILLVVLIIVLASDSGGSSGSGGGSNKNKNPNASPWLPTDDPNDPDDSDYPNNPDDFDYPDYPDDSDDSDYPMQEGQEKYCYYCNNKGIRECYNCNGKGYTEEYYSAPNYSGSLGGSSSTIIEKPCYYCKDGWVDCPYC